MLIACLGCFRANVGVRDEARPAPKFSLRAEAASAHQQRPLTLTLTSDTSPSERDTDETVHLPYVCTHIHHTRTYTHHTRKYITHALAHAYITHAHTCITHGRTSHTHLHVHTSHTLTQVRLMDVWSVTLSSDYSESAFLACSWSPRWNRKGPVLHYGTERVPSLRNAYPAPRAELRESWEIPLPGTVRKRHASVLF